MFRLNRAVSLLALILMLLLATACNHLFYYPLPDVFLTPEQRNISYEDVKIPSSDGVQLAAWVMTPAPNLKKNRLILHFHGNGENMTSHFLYVAWLVNEGYHVLTFDYRGYGQSSAVAPTQAGLIEDSCATLAWIQRHPRLKKLPLAVIAQSLGGTVATASLPLCPPKHLRGVVFDSTYSSYRHIARLKLASFWLTWPLQYPLSWLISDEVDLTKSVAKLHVPVLFFHSIEDPVVPYELGRDLYYAAAAPKQFIDVPTIGHTAAFAADDSPMKQVLLRFFDKIFE